MPRGYRHIQEYEKEIFELRAQGKTGREIREKFGFDIKTIREFYYKVQPSSRQNSRRNSN